MTALVDTSALYAFLDRDDRFHQVAVETLDRLLEERRPLTTHNYVVVEAVALVQRRLGPDAVLDLEQGPLDTLRVVWVEAEVHATAWAALRAARIRDVSFVDRVSFEVMRRRGIREAFAFDAHFTDAGFELVPDRN